MKRKQKNICDARVYSRNRILCFAALAVCIATAAVGMVGYSAHNAGVGDFSVSPVAEIAVWSSAPVSQSAYVRGAEFTVPERTVNIDGTDVKASAVLIFPDGDATSADKVTLSQAGKYTIRYTAAASGKTVADTVTFDVAESLYSVGTAFSSVTYGKWTPSDGSNISTSGLMVRLAEKDTFTFNKPLAVGSATRNDSLIKLFATPDTCGKADFEKIVVTLTDVLDKNVFLRISARAYSVTPINPAASYCLAGGNGQRMKGHEITSSNNKIHVENEWGAPFGHSFFGADDQNRDFDTRLIDFRYEASANSVYVGNTFVIDLDSPQYYSDVWSGFPSGQALLSVSGDFYNGDTANFCIAEIGGETFTEDSGSVTVVDTVAPVIKVDAPQTGMPSAPVGSLYPVPAATAHDGISGECKVNVRAYYNYVSQSTAAMVDIEDGKFRVKQAGRYAIVYSATDRSGNTATKTLFVSAENTPEPTVSFESEKQQSGVAGAWIPVPEPALSGGSGDLAVTVTATCGDAVYPVTDGFRPEKAGEYTVRAVATDYVGRTAESAYTVVVTSGDKPIFVEKPDVPHCLIAGYAYKFPVYYAIDYRSGAPVQKEAKLSVTDANGTRDVASNDTVTFSVASNGDTVTLVYTCDGATETVSVPCILPKETVNGQSILRLENYLVGSGIAATPDSEGIIVTATENNGGWTFANRLLAENCNITLRGIAGACGYGALRIEFADGKNPENKIVTRLSHNGNAVDVTVGGQTLTFATGLMIGGEVTVRYTDGKIQIGNVLPFEVPSFGGFASGKVTVSVYFEDVTATARYMLVEVNGHKINNNKTDRIAPRIAVANTCGGTAQIGSTVTLPRASAGDTLTPTVDFTVTVFGPDNKPVSDINGTLLSKVDPEKEYTIKLDAYGQYRVVYTAADSDLGMSVQLPYTVTVLDTVAPVIEIQGEKTRAAKAGDVLMMPTFAVTDDVTAKEELTVCVFVKTPRGSLIYLDGADSVKASEVGIYEFRVTVIDAAGNCAVQTVTYTVA